MAGSNRWTRLVERVAVVEIFLLIAQYLLGIWTNVYAPAQFVLNSSGMSTQPGSLVYHVLVGFLLFLVGVVILILAGLSRDLRLICLAAVLPVAVFVAGEFGSAFERSTPNNPIYSFGMGVMFIVALFATMGILALSRNRRMLSAPSAAPAARETQPS
ncbi:MAG: hypothetical protein WAN87_03455 [Thermoplasmata archaeon]